VWTRGEKGPRQTTLGCDFPATDFPVDSKIGENGVRETSQTGR
jgi:hypothetical protein